jgi:glyoxylase-like metal-dependent hydrolase (beta-lactamase superfamily II)
MPVLTKAPQTVFANPHSSVFAFPPNRETLGGTAYLIVETDPPNNRPDEQPSRNILVDCPALNETHQAFITAQGGIGTLFITHRGGMAQVPEFQKTFGCQVLIQEQEAYLLPTVATETFHHDQTLSPTSRVFWTPGHSPGSACLYHSNHGGVLFTGRHLIPNQAGAPQPLRLSKTFHWPRQLRYSQQLLADFTPDTLSYICPGGNTGFLRGEKKIAQAYSQLQTVDWETLKVSQPSL